MAERDTHEEAERFADRLVEELPAPYEIPDELWAEWRKLDPHLGFDLRLPRGAFEALLFSLLSNANASLAAARMANALDQNDRAEAIEFLKELGRACLDAQNAARRFMALVITAALRTTSDGE